VHGVSLIHPVTELEAGLSWPGVNGARQRVHPVPVRVRSVSRGPSMMRQLSSAADDEVELSELGRRASRKALRGLRRLLRDDLLDTGRVQIGCYRLLRHRDTLKDHVEGAISSAACERHHPVWLPTVV
jgi:hypothetical protein